ncbi:MAG: nucleoside hydrolase [Devosia sp.]|uniref:nucleoside hydrolase n=1 Tax=Devosia sp. TaxID=1871048 RepID=UPI002637A770|nr:nucleoside hydrolase [Devosia sp.]MDB5538142.1 nucleoside hydrolase [Devosia sp.]MDB5586058.1 nucleoside hydrolase [Devosia sp.]
MSAPSTRRVIIDTDPGLDDAVAILFALNSRRFDVLGLTSVAGNIGINITTKNAGRLLALLDRESIPVITGAAAPLARKGIEEAGIHGNDGLGGVVLPEPLAKPHGYAPFWMAEQLRANHAGSVDILALGPLTNIALLLRDHADAARRIGSLIVMGGVVHDKGNVGPHSEFNFACDPEAVDAVLRSGLDVTLIPLDVTRKVRASVEFVQALRTGIAGNAAADLISAYFQDGHESRPLHDPCVMLLALAPELFGIETRNVSVDLSDGPDAGALVAGMASVKIAMRVDVEGVLGLLAQGLA